MPVQLQARSGWMIVLSMAETLTLYGALGVFVGGFGVGVRVGGISEIGVLVGCTVMVGASVGVSVPVTGVGVQVASSWMGVMVTVGGMKAVGKLGGSGFSGVVGLMKMYAKNTPTATAAR